MKRRNFLIGTGSAAIGGSALIGTSAFSQVDAHRSVSIQVAEDDNAYLGMNDCMSSDGETTPNSSFADLDGDGHLQVDMGPSGNGGQGVNSKSISWFDNVFQLCNQGKEDVCLWIEDKTGADPERVTFYMSDSAAGETPDRFAAQDGDRVMNDSDLQTFSSVEDSIHLGLGECVCVGIEVFTKPDDSFEITQPAEGDQLLDQVSLVADAGEEACKTTTVCGAEGEFNCAQINPDGDGIGSHQLLLENVGEIDINQDLRYAVLDSPDQDDEATDLNPLAPGGTDTESGESAFPVAGVIAYVPPEECDEVIGTPRDEWPGFEDSDLLTLPKDSDGTVRVDLIEGLTESRYTEIQNISSYSELEAAFDDGTTDPSPNFSSDAYLTHIDYSVYNLDAVDTDDISQGNENEFETRLVNSGAIPKCNGSGS